MPSFVTWVLGILNVIQFVQFLIERGKRSNVVAAKKSLAAMRAMCTEAVKDEKIIDSADKGRAFASHIAYLALSIENTLSAIVPENELPKRDWLAWLRRSKKP